MMDFRKFIKKVPVNEEQSTPQQTGVNTPSGEKSDAEYYATVNPATGVRFDIPLLNTLDPEYYFKYVKYMKLREESPDTFNQLINWE